MQRGDRLTLSLLFGTLLIIGLVTFKVQQGWRSAPATPARTIALESSNSQLENRDGTRFSINSTEETVLVVHTWASWCPECANTIPALAELSQTYDVNEVRFVAVNRSEMRSVSEAFLQQFTLPNTLEIVFDPTDAVFAATAGFTAPETVVFNQDGDITHRQANRLNTQELQAAIAQTRE